MNIAPPSARGLRTLRAATATTLPSSAPISGHRSSQAQNRRPFSSRPLPPAEHRLTNQQLRQQQFPLLSQPLCWHHRQPRLPTAGSRRSFHLSSIVNATVAAAEAAIVQLHAVTHTPWYITIPLVALGVNVVFRLPFTVHARKIALKQELLTPLSQAWAAGRSKQLIGEQNRARKTQGAPVTSDESLQAGVMKESAKEMKRLHKEFGVQAWKLYGSIMVLPAWLVSIEALRRLCGAPTGLLGLLFRTGGGDSAATAASTAASTAAATAASSSAENVDVASIASAASPASSVADSAASLIDPTLATGGCLWFPDLTMADPYCVLPFALSAMLVANVVPTNDNARRAVFGLQPKHGKGVTSASVPLRNIILPRTLLLLSLAVGPLTLYFPAAIHLYWLASSMISFGMTRGVRTLIPSRTKTIRPAMNEDTPWVQPRKPAGEK